MTINERISLIPEALGITLYQIAKDTGIKNQTLYEVVGGKNRVSSHVLCRLAETYENLNARWLLTGRGQMFVVVENPARASPEAQNAVLA